MSYYLRLVLACCLWLALFRSESHAALVVSGYAPDRHDRFNATDKQNFIGAPYDWSGVGHAGGPWATLVSPSYFLSATHYHPAVESIVSFYSDNNAATVPFNSKVVSGAQIDNSDLWLGRLEQAVPVENYAVAQFASTADFVGRELFTYGLAGAGYSAPQSMRLGRNEIDGFIDNFSHPNLGASVTDVVVYDYDPSGGVGADEAQVVGGDSGAPTFVIVNGQPLLVGIHWFRYDQTNPVGSGSGDSFVPSYINSINAAMTGESLTVVAVPEPSSLALVLVAIGGYGMQCARRKRRRTLRLLESVA